MTITVSASAVIELTEKYTASLTAFTEVVKQIVSQIEGQEQRATVAPQRVYIASDSVKPEPITATSLEKHVEDTSEVQTDAEDKPKRKRRTKAEMEAEAAAKTMQAAAEIIAEEPVEEETSHFSEEKAQSVTAGQVTSPTPVRKQPDTTEDALSTWEKFRAEVMRINSEGAVLDKTFVPRIQKELADQFKVNKLSDVYANGMGANLLKLMRTELAVLKDKAAA